MSEKHINNRDGDMTTKVTSIKTDLPKGVMFNAYPDSIGQNMTDTVDMLKRPEFKMATR